LSLQQLRYGVFVDIAQRAYSGKPVAISMGYLNAVWQARPGSHSSITEHSLHGITPSKKGKSVTYVSGTPMCPGRTRERRNSNPQPPA